MPILLGSAKLGGATKLGIPVTMFYVQVSPNPPVPINPVFKEHLRVIQRPLTNDVFPYIACNGVARDDIRDVPTPQLIERYQSILNAALQLRNEIPNESYQIKVSIGYIAKLFPPAVLGDVPQFVNAICDIPDVDQVMASWHIIDEPVVAADEKQVTADQVHNVVQAFHTAQVARGKNWPFIYIEYADGRDPDKYPPDPQHPENQYGWWPPTPDGTDRYYDPGNFTRTDINGSGNDASKIYAFYNAIATVNANGVPAQPILMPDYYSFASGNWKYTVLPPMRKWKKIQEWWTYTFQNAPVYALMEGAAQINLPFTKTKLAGHIDMHNQMRMALNFESTNAGNKYRFNGLGLWGWSSSDTASEELRLTRQHWTYDPSHLPQSYFSSSNQMERWGEAVANEVWRATETEGFEFYPEAIPDTTGMVEVVADTETTNLKGFWIKFNLAERARVHFEIINTGFQIVRILDWGYKINSNKPGPQFNYLELYPLAAGRYHNLVRDTSEPFFPESRCRPSTQTQQYGLVSGDMNGAAQWWDVKDFNNVEVPLGTYFVNMIVNGNFVNQWQVFKGW